ncbi:ArsR/SmtB family transcription factor [Halobaculum sp. MBLA0147]|uniref:ArsR/SmtB family transcription factor n=1 Tax=Halobaculum sp. MBLA0147 TaxID=3079934 RepID=UPI0035265503
MADEGDLEAIGAVLEDDTTRRILAETSSEPMTVNQLATHVDASKPTIYRRIERLEDHDLVAATIHPSETGPHEKVFRATFDRVVVSLEDGTYTYDIERTERMSDRLTRFVDKL